MTEFNQTIKFMLDVVLPITMIVGTGIGTYLFTGGEEEYPPNEELLKDENESDEIKETEIPSNIQHETEAEDIEQSLLVSEAPEWAIKIEQQLKSIHEDLLEVKSRLPQGSFNTFKDVPSTTTNQNKDKEPKAVTNELLPRPTFGELQQQMHNAVYRFTHQLPDEISSNVYQLLDTTDFIQSEQKREESTSLSKPYQEGVDLLLLFLKNVLKNSTVPRYRRISINNTNFKTVLKPLTGYHSILTSVGFQLKGIYYEFEWNLIANDGNLASSPDNSSNAPPSIEDAHKLISNAINLLTSLKTDKFVALKLMQEQRLQSCTDPFTSTEVQVEETVDSNSPLIINEYSEAAKTPVLTKSVVSTPLSKMNLYPNASPMVGTPSALKFDEILRKVTKSQDIQQSKVSESTAELEEL